MLFGAIKWENKDSLKHRKSLVLPYQRFFCYFFAENNKTEVRLSLI